MSRKFWIVSLCTIAVTAAVIFGILCYHSPTASIQSSAVAVNTDIMPASTLSIASSSAACLRDDEMASYTIGERPTGALTSTAHVVIGGHLIENQTPSFSITNLDPTYHSIELHNCFAYAIRQFNFDSKTFEPLPDFNEGLWRYDYAGNGSEIVSLAGENSSGTPTVFYNYDFRIDPGEKYLALEDSLSGVVTIDGLKSLNSLFTLPTSKILEKNPNISGSIGFESGGWSSDGRYFWFDFFNDAEILGFVRIDTTNWSYQAFTAPTTTMGGDAFNPDTGMTTYETNVAPWTGDAAIDQQYKNIATQSGQISLFYIYDLLTNQNYLVATTTDPTYYFQPKWISDTQLQYSLQDGATSTYTVSP